MITISSKAGQRLAKARQRLNETEIAQGQPWLDALDEFDEAATLLAEELIADRHHLVEGD